MTHHDDFERTLAGWFDADGRRRAPAGMLDAVAADITTRRQVPYWIAALRGQAMLGRSRVEMPGRRAILLAAAVASLVLLLALAAAASKPSNPLGAGLMAFVENGDVLLANPDGSDARVVLHADGVAFSSVAWSPDASRLAIDGESGVLVFDVGSASTTFVGGSNPTWSPDGRKLAVLDQPAWGTAGGPRLRLVDSATLATLASYAFSANSGLAWSPNGRWIAATGNCTGTACPTGEDSASNALIRIDVATGEVVELDAPSGHLDGAREPTWSPDSKRIAFIRWGGGGVRCGDALLCHTDVLVADADGANSTKLVATGSADEPSWSPDGQWVAFRELIRTDSGNPPGMGLAIERPDGSGHRQVAAAAVEGYTWSPHGDHLWFAVRDAVSTSAAVWETSIDGVARRLGPAVDQGATSFGGTGLPFAWQALGPEASTPVLPRAVAGTPSPTLQVVSAPAAAAADLASAWPLLATTARGGCDVVRVSTADGSVSDLWNACDPQPTSSSTWSWSPSGSTFATVRDGELSLIEADGRVRDHIVAGDGFNGVTWSPDGHWLSLSGDRNVVVRPDGSGLLEAPGFVSWSPDSRLIAAPGQDGTLLIGPPAGPLRAVGSFPSMVTWAPDASRFAFIRDGNVWTAASDGTDVRAVTSFALGGASSVAWSPDGRWIAVVATHGLWTLHADGSDQHWFDLGRSNSAYAAVWSPDSSRLAVQTNTEPTPSGQKLQVLLLKPGGGPAILADDASSPTWSPDGRFLVVSDTPPDGSNPGSLAAMYADGSGRVDLGTTNVDLGSPVFVR